MKRNLLLSIIISSLWAATPVRAAEMTFTVESAAAHALSNNMDLAAARYSIAEAQGRLQQAGRWTNPEWESEFKPNVNGREGALYTGFTQRFPLTSRLRLEKTVSRARLAVAEAEVRDFERKLALQVRTTAVRLAALDAQRRLKDRQIENNRELASSIAQAAEAGESSRLEAAQIELDESDLITQRARLNADYPGLMGELRTLLALPGDTAIRIEESLSALDPPAEIPVDWDRRADYAAAQARVNEVEQAIKLARAERWEDATVSLFGELERREDAPVGIRSEQMVGLRFSLPLPLWNKNKGRIAEKEATAQRAEKEAEALKSRIAVEARSAREEMAAATALSHTISHELLPKARQLEERLTAFYRAGESPLGDILRARARRLQLEADALDALRDFHLARARYLAATATPTAP